MNRRNDVALALILVVSLSSVSCRRDSGGSSPHPELVHAETLQPLANNQIVLHVPESCQEDTAPEYCESWLGLREETRLGMTHIGNRISFAIEDLMDDGRFHIAVYPDCKLDERAAQELAAHTPDNSGATTTDKTPNLIKEGTGEPPALVSGADSSVVTPPEDNDPNILPPPAQDKSPHYECRKLVTVGANQGDPVELVDPAQVDDFARWTLHFPAEGHPIFVSTKPCAEGLDCRIRLLMADDGYLTAAHVTDNELGLKSFWKKISGKISKTFNTVESGIADVKKQVGTSVNVEKLGNKKLYVSAALPAAKLYSAVRDQGPEILAQANGTLNDGAVYAKVGGKYIEQGGTAAIEGAKYVAEYVMNNACYLGIMAHLVNQFGNLAVAYEAALSSHFLEYYNKLAGKMSYDSMANDKSSPTYYEIRAIALVYALQATAISGKFKLDDWRNLITDIILSAFAGNIKAGYTPILISKVATAICKGTDEAISTAHAVVSAPNSNGLSDDCLEGIKNRAVNRYENVAEDMCYALRDEIRAATAHVPADNKVTNEWQTSIRNCPADANAEGYLNLLEGVGCQKKRLITDQNEAVDDVPIDDTTILTHQRYWGRTSDWRAAVKCPAGMVAVGMCSSGGNPDCYRMPKELLCAYRSGETIVNNSKYVDVYKNWGQDTAYCPTNFAVTEMCTSGGNKDCSGWSQIIRCSAVNANFLVDYSNCDSKESKSWSGRVEATAPNHVMVGICSSGKRADCGENNDITKAATFCPVIPRAASNGTQELFRFYSRERDDYLLTANIGENPYNYRYQEAGFKVYTADGTDRKAIYRCLLGTTKHFASNASNCEGQKSEGLLGYLSTKTGKPVYRCYNGKNHLITADKGECAGYTVEAVMGYAP